MLVQRISRMNTCADFDEFQLAYGLDSSLYGCSTIPANPD